MKKLVIIALLFFIIGTDQSHAQLGIKLGYNFAKLGGKDLTQGYSEKSLNNFHAGIFFDKDLIPLIDIRVGLDYSPKGFKEVNGDLYNQVKLNYLELPILAKLKLGPVYGLGGFYGAYAINGENKAHLLGIDITEAVEFDTDKINRFDAGMKFGLGFQIGLGPVHVFAQTEYSFGLMNVSSKDNTDYKNNVFGVAAGVLLGFK